MKNWMDALVASLFLWGACTGHVGMAYNAKHDEAIGMECIGMVCFGHSFVDDYRERERI